MVRGFEGLSYKCCGTSFVSGYFPLPLVLQEPLTNYEERMAVNVSCAAMGQTGPCAPEAVTSGLSGFPCRQVPRERRSKSLTCYVAP